MIEAVERICAAGRRHGKAVGMFIPPSEDCARWQALGATLFILGSDHGFMLEGARALARRLQAA